MRLINTDELEEFIKNNICAVGDELLAVGKDDRWHKLLDFIPTAYDVDRVVQRLEERKRYAETKAAECDENGNTAEMDFWDKEAGTIRCDIEIVKSGGVKE